MTCGIPSGGGSGSKTGVSRASTVLARVLILPRLGRIDSLRWRRDCDGLAGGTAVASAGEDAIMACRGVRTDRELWMKKCGGGNAQESAAARGDWDKSHSREGG